MSKLEKLTEEATTSRFIQQNIPTEENNEGRGAGKSKGKILPDSQQQVDSAGGKHTEKKLVTQSETGKYGKVRVVTETHAGHVILVDETEGNERIYIMHPNGTYINIDPDSRTDKTEGNQISLINGDMQMEISGDEVVFNHGEVKVTMDKDLTTDIIGNKTETIKKALTITVTKDVLIKGKNVTVEAAETATVKGRDCLVDASGSATVKAAGVVTISGASISLN